MAVLTYIISILSMLILGAHFLRGDNTGITLVAVLLPFLLLYKKRWVLYIISGLLIIGAGIWIDTAVNIYQIRVATGQPAMRMLIILGSVSLLTLTGSGLLLSKKMMDKYPASISDIAISSSFFITGILVFMAFLKVKIPILMIERFFPGFGGFEIIAISLYAAFVTEKMLDPMKSSNWRRIIWTVFSVVFFSQLIIGLIGYEQFLMTGKLHLPVPAMIMAGPLYRLEISIMIFLFLGSIILVGPAWCSHLCYFGVWDDYASRNKLKPKILPKNWQIVRGAILVLVAIAALGLNVMGVSPLNAAIAGLIFGIAGVGVMLFYSRRKGVMVHCTVYCPIGFFAVVLGKISPFRIKIDSTCDECAMCKLSCRYDALNMADIKNRKPNINCTLCGDCVGSCDKTSINYRFFKMKPESARRLFIVLAVSLHAAFLALGRL